jgi:uncharacterized phosphosugar-binding protein
MSASLFLSEFRKVFDRIENTQLEAIRKGAGWIAEAMMADRFAVVFGSGHSAIPTEDVYPRIGSFPGWLPIHDLPATYMSRLSGDLGLRQALFLEKVEGYGSVVLANYALEPRDVMIVISNSGVNTMGVEMALKAKEMGLKTIGITSREHSQLSASYHSSGQRLYEVVDLVIDNCMPPGDALVSVPGFPSKVAAGSTIAGCLIMQSLAAETAAIFSTHNYIPPVFPSHNSKETPEQVERMEAQVEQLFAEDARRVRQLLR